MSAPAPLRGVRAAVVFLTRVPVGGMPYSDADWRWSAAHFPLVGALVGAAVGAVDRALLPLGAWAAAVFAMGASLVLTGALHEDGLADTSDALFGAHTRDKIFLILKDSRIGVFGGSALVVSIAGRAALVARLGSAAVGALALAGAVARLAAIWMIATMRYVTDAAVLPVARRRDHRRLPGRDRAALRDGGAGDDCVGVGAWTTRGRARAVTAGGSSPRETPPGPPSPARGRGPTV